MAMEGALSGFLQAALSRKEAADDTELKLLEEIEAVKNSLNAVSERFEYQSDPDLVEACIYEMKALAARYRYLTKEARRLGVRRHVLGNLRQI